MLIGTNVVKRQSSIVFVCVCACACVCVNAQATCTHTCTLVWSISAQEDLNDRLAYSYINNYYLAAVLSEIKSTTACAQEDININIPL